MRTESEIKAEALREAADEADSASEAAWLRRRADVIAEKPWNSRDELREAARRIRRGAHVPTELVARMLESHAEMLDLMSTFDPMRCLTLTAKASMTLAGYVMLIATDINHKSTSYSGES